MILLGVLGLAYNLFGYPYSNSLIKIRRLRQLSLQA